MGWVDTHCHLQLDGRNPVELLDRAEDVDWVVVPGIDAASSKASLELASRLGNRVLGTAGLHPHESSRWKAERAKIVELATSASAIGETGLDFYRNLSDPEVQKATFREHITLASDFGKPLITHCRDAFEDTYNIIEQTGIGHQIVMHCWTGGPRWTRRFLELGVIFSFAGPVAFETGDTVRRGAALVPPERAMVETDTPYLAPPPHRGQPNEPAFVRLIGSALAQVWGLEEAEVAALTSRRAAEVFGR